MNDDQIIRGPQGQTLSMTRRFAAPRERVFDAFSSFEALGRWFGPPQCPCQGGEVDFRVGGRYRLDMKAMDENACAPENAVVSVGGEYRLIDPPSKSCFRGNGRSIPCSQRH